MKFDFRKLRGKIIEKYGSIDNFSKAYGKSKQAISMKLNNKIAFSSEDIIKMTKMLDISHDEIGDYFFTILV